MTVSVDDGPLVECLLSGRVAILALSGWDARTPKGFHLHTPLFFLLFF